MTSIASEEDGGLKIRRGVWFKQKAYINNTKEMKLYVGNLDEKVEDYHLKEAFQEFGMVASAKVIKDKYSGKSRGFGFVEMPEEEQAQKVIKTVNGASWEGKIIVVKKAFK